MEWLIDNPDVLALPAAGLGILMRIVIHYWAIDCRDMPTDFTHLFTISRAHRPTFSSYWPEISRILETLLPEIKTWREVRDKRIAQMKELGAKGSGILALRAAERRAAREARNKAAPLVLGAKAQETRAKDKASIEPGAAVAGSHGAKGKGGGFVEM